MVVLKEFYRKKLILKIVNRGQKSLQNSPVDRVKIFTVKPLEKKTKISFQDLLSPNAGQKYCRMLQGEHSAILSTFIMLSFVINIFVLSIFEWSLKTGFTVFQFHVAEGLSRAVNQGAVNHVP